MAKELLEILNLTAEISELKAIHKGPAAGALSARRGLKRTKNDCLCRGTVCRCRCRCWFKAEAEDFRKRGRGGEL